MKLEGISVQVPEGSEARLEQLGPARWRTEVLEDSLSIAAPRIIMPLHSLSAR